MMIEKVYPKTKPDLVSAVQKMRINKIEVIDGYAPADKRGPVKVAKAMATGSHDLIIIMVPS